MYDKKLPKHMAIIPETEQEYDGGKKLSTFDIVGIVGGCIIGTAILSGIGYGIYRYVRTPAAPGYVEQFTEVGTFSEQDYFSRADEIHNALGGIDGCKYNIVQSGNNYTLSVTSAYAVYAKAALRLS